MTRHRADTDTSLVYEDQMIIAGDFDEDDGGIDSMGKLNLQDGRGESSLHGLFSREVKPLSRVA